MNHSNRHITAPLSYLRMYPEEAILDHLKHTGLSKHGFRRLLRLLGVPILHFPEGNFINALTFSIAMQAVSRLGERDFAVPGSEPLRSGRTEGMSTALDQEQVGKDLKFIIGELLSAQRLGHSRISEKPISQVAERALNTLLQEKILRSREIALDEQESMGHQAYTEIESEVPDSLKDPA